MTFNTSWPFRSPPPAHAETKALSCQVTGTQDVVGLPLTSPRFPLRERNRSQPNHCPTGLTLWPSVSQRLESAFQPFVSSSKHPPCYVSGPGQPDFLTQVFRGTGHGSSQHSPRGYHSHPCPSPPVLSLCMLTMQATTASTMTVTTQAFPQIPRGHSSILSLEMGMSRGGQCQSIPQQWWSDEVALSILCSRLHYTAQDSQMKYTGLA